MPHHNRIEGRDKERDSRPQPGVRRLSPPGARRCRSTHRHAAAPGVRHGASCCDRPAGTLTLQLAARFSSVASALLCYAHLTCSFGSKSLQLSHFFSRPRVVALGSRHDGEGHWGAGRAAGGDRGGFPPRCSTAWDKLGRAPAAGCRGLVPAALCHAAVEAVAESAARRERMGPPAAAAQAACPACATSAPCAAHAAITRAALRVSPPSSAAPVRTGAGGRPQGGADARP